MKNAGVSEITCPITVLNWKLSLSAVLFTNAWELRTPVRNICQFLKRMMKAASLIEEMGRKSSPPRKPDVATVNGGVDRLDQEQRVHSSAEEEFVTQTFRVPKEKDIHE